MMLTREIGSLWFGLRELSLLSIQSISHSSPNSILLSLKHDPLHYHIHHSHHQSLPVPAPPPSTPPSPTEQHLPPSPTTLPQHHIIPTSTPIPTPNPALTHKIDTPHVSFQNEPLQPQPRPPQLPSSTPHPDSPPPPPPLISERTLVPPQHPSLHASQTRLMKSSTVPSTRLARIFHYGGKSLPHLDARDCHLLPSSSPYTFLHPFRFGSRLGLWSHGRISEASHLPHVRTRLGAQLLRLHERAKRQAPRRQALSYARSSSETGPVHEHTR